MRDKIDIKGFTLKELEKALSGIGEQSYRARQIFSWLYQRGIKDFSEIDNIPKKLITKLDQIYCISSPTPRQHLKSRDKTEKILFELSNGHLIETVLICAKGRKTLCLSTQVGCKFSCSFCASGLNGFKRDLTVSEIIGQILYFRNDFKHKITNYVFMGMGEPLDNYENVAKAVMIMNEPKGLAIGARRITVSTCGIIPGIEKLNGLGIQVNLSISLHGANDGLRNRLMPINKKYPLEKLLKACEDFKGNTGRMITLEYVLIKGINDSTQDIDGLAAIADRLKAKVNLILYSPVPGLNFKIPNPGDIDAVTKRLTEKGVSATLRKSKGRNIQAACGQLAGTKNEI
ncbi:MAG: 23S rRNA (adenine(2503)-C(2))-methyltransferase RlmN [Candidatus Omnitrophica bacterium]|nr:23S rRNA (adenine(2503)-C(2))-methyltransferase RlmN [Candidatus Omnitrophota bacterium]